MPSLHALVVALLLGAAAGMIAALWVTVVDARGLVTSVAS
jgi:predicted outer membrane lipoprotein